MTSISLRPYQIEAINRVRGAIAAGRRRIVLVLATGGGKTVVASSVVASAVARGTHVLFVAHRRELIKQAFIKLIRNGIDPLNVGVVMAGVPPLRAPVTVDLSLSDSELWQRHARINANALVQVASIDTLRQRVKPQAQLIILDECHRAVSKSNVDLIAQYPDAVLLGLTATPYRADNRGLSEEVAFKLSGGVEEMRPLFEDLVVVASPKTLIAEGFLVEPRVFTVPAAELPDISRVKIKGSDYDPAELSAAVDRDPLVGSVIEHWERHARGVRTVVFPVSIEHSHHVVARFRAAGVTAEHVDGNTPTIDRDAILARVERGETLVVSSVGVLCEGWDQPSVKCCALLRPTKSTGLYLQMAGRILRPWRGQQAVILDHAGCTLDHGFVTQDREFSLESRAKKRGPSAVPAKTCPSCWAVIQSSAKACPECDHEFAADAAARGIPEEAAGQLVEVVAPSDDDLRASWAKLCADCVKQGYKPGWVSARWSELYPSTRAPEGCVPPTAEQCTEHVNRRAEVFDELLRTAIEKGFKIGWAKSSFKSREGVWPSLDLFEKTQTAENLRTVVAGLASVVILARLREPVAHECAVAVVDDRVVAYAAPAETVASNDVELIDYAIGE